MIEFGSARRDFKPNLKGMGQVTINNPVISVICIVAHTWSLCSVQILVNGMNPQ